MASDSSGLYIFGFILLLIVAFFAYAFLSDRRTEDKRKQLIRAFRAAPATAKDAPILVQGPARHRTSSFPRPGNPWHFMACLS